MALGQRTAQGARKSAVGRKPWDEVLIIKHVPSQSKGFWSYNRFPFKDDFEHRSSI